MELMDEATFWGRIDVRGPDECWEWQGRSKALGYGRALWAGKPQGAHRISWALHHGPIPAGMHVCHHCDNPPCVNPAHLFLGTSADNLRDMRSKGRGQTPHPQGEAVSRSRLTTAQVLEIRRRRAAGEATRVLAREFGVSRMSIKRIERRERWMHV